MGDTGGRFHSRIGGLPEGNHFPGRGRVGLQGLKGHLPDGDDALVSARPDKLARIPQGLDHRSKNWLPSLSVGPTFKQGLQAKRIVRGHRRSGRRFGGGRSPGRSGGLLSGRLFIFLSLLLFLLSLLPVRLRRLALCLRLRFLGVFRCVLRVLLRFFLLGGCLLAWCYRFFRGGSLLLATGNCNLESREIGHLLGLLPLMFGHPNGLLGLFFIILGLLEPLPRVVQRRLSLCHIVFNCFDRTSRDHQLLKDSCLPLLCLRNHLLTFPDLVPVRVHRRLGFSFNMLRPLQLVLVNLQLLAQLLALRLQMVPVLLGLIMLLPRVLSGGLQQMDPMPEVFRHFLGVVNVVVGCCCSSNTCVVLLRCPLLRCCQLVFGAVVCVVRAVRISVGVNDAVNRTVHGIEHGRLDTRPETPA
mmetsp:Transcript_57090/g.122576  ORF Transcript_57090/g.122576 Transcript_57090/m.122576 type:complete len:413 (-) Transcript_57090:190-1428(-)